METIHKRILGVLAAVFVLLAVAVTVVYFTQDRTPNTDNTPSFTPPLFDGSAQSGDPSSEITEDMIYVPFALKEGFVVSLCAAPMVQDGGDGTTATFYFTADAGNTVWVRLLVLTEDGREIGSTGILKPGTYVKTVALTENPGAGTNVLLKVLSYEPDTYYSMGSASVKVTLR